MDDIHTYMDMYLPCVRVSACTLHQAYEGAGIGALRVGILACKYLRARELAIWDALDSLLQGLFDRRLGHW